MAEEATLVLRADTSNIVQADKNLDALNKTGQRTTQVQKQVTANQARLGSTFSRNNSAIQNTAFQLQDIVVQLEAGVPVTRTLGQQLPQLLGGFGALGAVAGVVAGLGFALGGVLLSGLTAASEGVEDLDERIVDLNDNIEDLTESQLEYLQVLKRQEITDATKQVAELEKALAREEETLKRINSIRGGRSRRNTEGISEEISKLGAAADTTRQELGLLEQELEKLESGVGAFKEETSSATSELERNQKSITSIINALDVQAKAANDAANGTAFYRAEQLGATEVELSRIQSLQGIIDKQKELEEAERAAAAASAQAAREAEAADQKRLREAERNNARRIQLDAVTSQILIDQQSDFASQAASILAQNADANSVAAKAAYAISQGIQVAQAINNANLAYTQIIASIPPGDTTGVATAATIARAESIRGLGLATAALIAGNTVGTLAGRAIGGQVTEGQAYRVGEFGPETFVPNSSGRIIPNGQMAANDTRPVEVVNNIRVIGGGGDAQVTTQTTRQNDRKVIQDIVVDLMANQSSPARQALQRTSNVVPRGSR